MDEHTTGAAAGRRERKKAATRQAIADAALALFLERGYDAASIRDIADAADVATTTVFTHFPSKEALVFDRDEDREAELVRAVQEREEGEDVLDALQRHAVRTFTKISSHQQAEGFADLVRSTPALREYSERMWSRHAEALGAAIAQEVGAPADDLACASLARFSLDIPAIVRGRPHPSRAVEEIFQLLRDGWDSSSAGPRER